MTDDRAGDRASPEDGGGLPPFWWVWLVLILAVLGIGAMVWRMVSGIGAPPPATL